MVFIFFFFSPHPIPFAKNSLRRGKKVRKTSDGWKSLIFISSQGFPSTIIFRFRGPGDSDRRSPWRNSRSLGPAQGTDGHSSRGACSGSTPPPPPPPPPLLISTISCGQVLTCVVQGNDRVRASRGIRTWLCTHNLHVYTTALTNRSSETRDRPNGLGRSYRALFLALGPGK